MVEQSKQLGFHFSPLLAAGDVANPAIGYAAGPGGKRSVVVAMGCGHLRLHALETLQCMAERRKGARTGRRFQCTPSGSRSLGRNENPAPGKLAVGPKFLNPASPAPTLAQAGKLQPPLSNAEANRGVGQRAGRLTGSNTRDGLKATMLLMNGLVDDFNFAARLKGEKELSPPLPTAAQTPTSSTRQGYVEAEEIVHDPARPIPRRKRTLLTSCLVSAGIAVAV